MSYQASSWHPVYLPDSRRTRLQVVNLANVVNVTEDVKKRFDHATQGVGGHSRCTDCERASGSFRHGAQRPARIR